MCAATTAHLHLSTSELHLHRAGAARSAARGSATLSQLGTHSATLEDVFVTLTGRQLRDDSLTDARRRHVIRWSS